MPLSKNKLLVLYIINRNKKALFCDYFYGFLLPDAQGDFPPDFSGKRAAGNALHRRIVIVADPDGNDVFIGKADEPCIAVILRGAGFSGGKAGNFGAAAGSPD